MLAESSEVDKVTREASDEAIRRIIAALQSPEALSRLKHLRLQVRYDKRKSDQRLASHVQAHLSETAFLLSLLDDNVGRISSVKTTLRELQGHCEDCRDALPEKDYPHIRSVRILRNNLDASINLLSMFTRMPEVAQIIHNQLLGSRPSYKRCYLQIVGLYRLKDKAMESEGSISREMNATIIESRFESVHAVGHELELQLLDNVADCMDLAGDDPSILVDTLQVIEMEVRGDYKIFDKDIKLLSIECLEEVITDAFTEAFSSDDATHSEVVDIGKTLKALSKLLQDLSYFKQYVDPCFPPAWDILNFVKTRYFKWIQARVFHVSSDPTKLSSGVMLRLIKWLVEYKEVVLELDRNDKEFVTTIENHRQFLFQIYLERERKKMWDLFQSILRSDWKLEQPKILSGRFITSAPQDMFIFINTQLETCKQNLSTDYFLQSLAMFNELVVDYQNAQLSLLKESGVDRPEPILLALVNNAAISQENIAGVQEECLDFLGCELESDQFNDLEIQLEDLFELSLSGFVSVSLKSIEILGDKLIEFVSDEFFGELFHAEWLNDSQNIIVKSIVATVKSTLVSDYEPGITSQFYFAQLLKHILSSLTNAFIVALLESRLKFDEAGTKRVIFDFETLADIF